jgi:pyruvate,water dikinase
MALYDEMTLRLLKRWQAPILADTMAMVHYRALARLCERWVAPGDAAFCNDLLAGQGAVESTEPARKLVECFARIRNEPALAAMFRDLEPAALRAALSISSDPAAASFRAWLAEYLERYGSRSMNELKLETPTMREDPGFLFVTLQNYFRAPEVALASLKPPTDLREEAEARVRAVLRGHPLRRLFFFWVLRRTAMHVRDREAMRFARSRVYGLVRRLFLSYGSALEAAGILRSRDDVFFLSVPELQAYAEGRSLTQDLAALAAMRREEYHGFAAAGEPPDRFHTVGLPYYDVGVDYVPDAPPGNATGDVLRGTCCCAGLRRGVVRVIRSPDDDLRLSGEILAAPRTDPGWIPLYPSVSALLIEKGSVLSHSAIVAREMGIPTIVGIDNLMNRIADGDEVEVDAAAGTVRILSRSGKGSNEDSAEDSETGAP